MTPVAIQIELVVKTLTVILRNVINHPEDVSVTAQVESDSLLIIFAVKREDQELAIGEYGRTLRSLRCIGLALIRKEAKTIRNLEIQVVSQQKYPC